MSIALWKTVLAVAKVAAALLIVGSVLLFWRQHVEMASAWAAPDFSPPLVINPDVVSNTKDLSLVLGRFQRERPKPAEPAEAAPAPVITEALAKLGEITDAIVVYPPYEEGGFVPAIIFRWKPGQKPASEQADARTIRLGEALIEKSAGPLTGIPLQYKFVGCEHDPANPGFTYFLFDMKCDGTDIQKVHWKGEEPVAEQPKVADAGPTGPGPVTTANIHVGPPLSTRAVEQPATPEDVAVQPVPTPPVPAPPITLEQQPSGSLFDEEEGVYAPRQEGIDYLERNYEKILEDTRTQPYHDSDGRTGIRVVGIADASVANQFGIRKDDVILKINGIPVSNQSEAVNVVKAELKKKVNLIHVTIRRAAREFDKTFDTRDPATRRAAKKGFR